ARSPARRSSQPCARPRALAFGRPHRIPRGAFLLDRPTGWDRARGYGRGARLATLGPRFAGHRSHSERNLERSAARFETEATVVTNFEEVSRGDPVGDVDLGIPRDRLPRADRPRLVVS